MGGLFGGGGSSGKRTDKATAQLLQLQTDILKETSPLRKALLGTIEGGLDEELLLPILSEREILGRELSGIGTTFKGAEDRISEALSARGLGRSGMMGGALTALEGLRGEATRGAVRTARQEFLAGKQQQLLLRENFRSGRIGEALQATQLGTQAGGQASQLGLGLTQAGTQAGGQSLEFLGTIGSALAQTIDWTKAGTAAWGGITSLAGMIPWSDEQLKENINDLTLDKLLELRPVEFDWAFNGQHDVGFVAQEVQKIFPESVTTIQEYLAIDYRNIALLLLFALKKQLGIGH